MVSKGNSKASIYGDYVVEQVKEIARAGGGEFILIKLADKMGLSITHNLRRRLVTCQMMGLLDIGYKTVSGRGLCYNYIIHPDTNKTSAPDDYPF